MAKKGAIVLVMTQCILLPAHVQIFRKLDEKLTVEFVWPNVPYVDRAMTTFDIMLQYPSCSCRILYQQQEILKSAIGMFDELSIEEQCTDHYMRIKHHLYSAEWKYCHKCDFPDKHASHQSLAGDEIRISKSITRLLICIL